MTPEERLKLEEKVVDMLRTVYDQYLIHISETTRQAEIS